jgi:molybdate/tungstate transport system substrate-binding protein
MNKTVIAFFFIGAIVLGSSYFYFFKPEQEEPRILKVYCAGSLLYPLERVAEEFMKVYPNIELQVEGHGSIQVIRHPTELNDPADLLLVADYSLIPLMMYNKLVPDTEVNFTDWYIRFAGNEMVLAYTEQSLYQDTIDDSNWYEILSLDEVKLGISNPIIDALGYRALILLQLAEYYYNVSWIFEDVVGTWFDPDFESVDVGERTIIFVPEEERPVGEKISMRASSVQLIPLLQSGAIDYAFLYKSNTEQQEFPYIELPDEINLGKSEFDEFYSQAQVRFQHARFQTIGLDRLGKTIYYGMTISETAENPEDAILLAEFILSGEGKRIFSDLYHPVYDPAYTDNLDGVPQQLRKYLTQENYK